MFKGVYTVLTTPFRKDGNIDYQGIARNIEWQIGQGIHGLVSVGSTGEFASMGDYERRKVAATVMEAVNGRVPVIAGASAEATQKAVEYAKYAEEIGAKGVMVLPPPYCKPSQDEMFAHFARIADSIGIPVMVYNNPFTTGVDVQAETVARMFHYSPNLSAIKECTGDIRRLRKIRLLCEDKITIFCGWEDLAYECFLMGAVGWVSVIGNIVPKLAVELFDCVYGSKDLKRGWAVFLRILPMLEYLEYAGHAPQTLKYCLDAMGLAGGYSRLPRLPLTDADKAAIDAIFAELQTP